MSSASSQLSVSELLCPSSGQFAWSQASRPSSVRGDVGRTLDPSVTLWKRLAARTVKRAPYVALATSRITRLHPQPLPRVPLCCTEVRTTVPCRGPLQPSAMPRRLRVPLCAVWCAACRSSVCPQRSTWTIRRPAALSEPGTQPACCRRRTSMHQQPTWHASTPPTAAEQSVALISTRQPYLAP